MTAPIEVAYRRSGLEWRRLTFKTEQAFDRWIDAVADDEIEIRTRYPEAR